MTKVKKCAICWVTCSSCRWGFCRCNMNQQQIYKSNEIIDMWLAEWYKKFWLIDLVKQYETVDEIASAIQVWLDESLQDPYEKQTRVIEKRVKVNLRCEYPNMGIWARCTVCWEARRDKQHALDKRCSWKIQI